MWSEKLDSRISSSDRFIPRRANVNFDLSYYHIGKSNDTNDEVKIFHDTQWFNNTAKYHHNMNNYRSLLWKSMMPDGNRILVFSSPKRNQVKHLKQDQHSEKLWPVHPRQKPLLGPPSIVLDMPDLEANITYHVVDWGKKGYIATIYENEVHLWHPAENSQRVVTDTNKKVQKCVKWNVEGTHLSIALEGAGIAIWDCNAFKITVFSCCKCAIPCVVTAMEWTKDGYLITGCSRGRLCSWSPDSLNVCTRTYVVAHEGPIIGIKISSNENYIVTSGIDRNVRVWKWPKLSEHFEIYFREGSIRGIAWHPWRDSVLAIGGRNNITFWSVSQMKTLGSRPNPYKHTIVDCLTFNPLSAELVVSYYSFDESNKGFPGHFLTILKDLHHIVDEVQFHNGRVPYLLWDSTGTKLATASADENLCIWDFFGTSTQTEKKYLKLNGKKKFSVNMLDNMNIFNSCIR